jgi:hypothetical protein
MNLSMRAWAFVLIWTTGAVANVIWIEAERFQDIGGWTIDAQFRLQMGSTYLIAAGTGEPVRDAVTRVRIPRAGSWRVWVRCKDWHPPTSPGRFQVWIADRPLPVIFGEHKQGWMWQDGGTVELPAGDVKIALHDLTGYYGRCDAIVLALTEYRPPDELAALAVEREKWTGPYPVSTQRFDFVVVGGGYGGVCAAIQAARLGVRTALIQNRSVLGGNASREINVGPGGAGGHVVPFREPGICEEIAETRPRVDDWSAAIDEVIATVSNLTVFLDVEGTRAIMAGRRIEAVEAEDVVSGARYRLEAPLFLDATGDGVIAASAGCEFRHGEEARSEYNESRAPEQATRYTMGTTIVHHSIRMPTPQPYEPPPFAVKFSAEYFTHRRQNLIHGTWWIEYGGMRDTIAEAEEIRDELLRIIYGAFDWAKNHDPQYKEANRFYKLAPVPIVGGKRESRRFKGDYVLTQHDVVGGRIFEDAVAYGGWPIDIHPPQGIYGKDIPPAIYTRLERPYTIPYRCLYARDAENLFLAGRHISVTHVALGSTRLIQTIGLMGQAVGTAARLCLNYGVGPHGLYPEHIKELQRLLIKWDMWIPGVADDDPQNLARQATVRASSEVGDKSWEIVPADSKEWKPALLNVERSMEVMTATSGVRKIYAWLASSNGQPAHVVMRLSAPDEPELVVTTTVASAEHRWIPFTLPRELKPYWVYELTFSKSPQVVWAYTEAHAGRRRFRSGTEWKEARGAYLVRPIGCPQPLPPCPASLAVDGWSVPEHENRHMWRSDPTQPLPQWIELQWPQPVRFNTVHLVFDTNIYGRRPVADPGTSSCARSYRVLIRDGERWTPVVEVDDNWRRFRRHTFRMVETEAMRLEILDAIGAQEARLYEIRVYQEP